jgi:hypothetical protein
VLCSKSHRSQCNWACEGQIRDTEAYSSSCIDKTQKKKKKKEEEEEEEEKETRHNYEPPTAGTRVSSWNVNGM